jgi:hypothetical protein
LTLPSRQASQSEPGGHGARYRVRQFAELAGVTVKTLYHDDRVGLRRPNGRHTMRKYYAIIVASGHAALYGVALRQRRGPMVACH